MVVKPDAASARVMLVPLPPKSQSTTTPFGGSPGVACSAERAATESGTRAGATPPGARLGVVANAPRSASTVPAPNARGPRSRRVCRRRRCVPSRRGPRRAPALRYAATRPPPPTAPDRRPARRIRAAPCRAGSDWVFDGTPTSGARSSNTVSTDRRITRDGPSGPPLGWSCQSTTRESRSSTPCVSGEPHYSGSSPQSTKHPLTPRKPLMPGPRTPGWQRWV